MRISFWTALFLAALLRAWSLLDQTFTLDEGYSVLFSQVPLGSIFLSAGLDSNPPVGNAFFHLWCRASGYEPALMRLPGVLASLASLVLLWRLLQPLLPSRCTTFVVLFKAVSLYDVLYSRQLRVYPLAELLLVVSWLCLRRFIAAGNFRMGALWAVFSAAACHLHYFCSLVTAATAILALASAKGDRRQAAWAIAIFCLLVAPLAVPLAQQLLVHRSFGWIADPTAGALLVALYQLCGYSLPVLVAALVLLFAAGAIRNPLSGMAAAQEHSQVVILCCTQIALVVGLAALLSLLGASFFHPRYFFFIQVPFLSLVSLGLCPFRPPTAKIVSLLMVAAATVPCVAHVAQASSNPTGSAIIAQAAPSLSEGTLLVHETKCSFSVGQAYDRFRHRHRLLEGGGDSNVFHFPGLPPVFISQEEAKADPNAVLLKISQGCSE